MKRLCTICARGGSRGVPNKNLRRLNGKPLLVYSIDHARASGLFERIAVSSDSADILALAQASGVDDLVERPREMATDTAAKVPAIRHALATVEARHGAVYDTLVDLDATSPLRIPQDICGAVRLLEEGGVASVITGAPSHRSPYFNLVETRPDGSVCPAKSAANDVVRRQDAPSTYDMNASVYVWNAARFRADPRVFYCDTRLFEMPAERSHDIDSMLDFDIVEMIMRRTGDSRSPQMRFDLTGKVAVVTGGAGNLVLTSPAGWQGRAPPWRCSTSTGTQSKRKRRPFAAHPAQMPSGLRATSPIGRRCGRRLIASRPSLGPIDILHNNAATKGKDLEAFFAPVEDYDLAVWREVMAVNLDGMFLVAQEIGKRMVGRKKARSFRPHRSMASLRPTSAFTKVRSISAGRSTRRRSTPPRKPAWWV